MARSKKSSDYANNFPFYDVLWQFYFENKRRIKLNYKDVSKKYLDYNDISINTKAYLRKPQFEALEIYVFLKEFMNNRKIHEIFALWKERKEMFSTGSYYSSNSDLEGQLTFYDSEAENYDQVFDLMKNQAEDYPNYIYALSMGVGKTILMATAIFYEFLLASKYPKDERFCHNALVFAPDRTVRQSLKEIQTFDRAKVIPPEYASLIDSNIRFHFLDDSTSTLNTINGSKFNLIISNTQKIILKTKHTELSSKERLFNMPSANDDFTSRIGEFYGDLNELRDGKEVITNQRFNKLKRLEQLGIYVDEAHHMFGNELEKSLIDKKNITSLRYTINELADALNSKGSRVVACYNFTGTPYVKNTVLPEVVNYYGLKAAIDDYYLKRPYIQAYEHVKDKIFLNNVLSDFFITHNDRLYEGLLPKIAIFASTIEELINEVKPEVEKILSQLNIPLNKVLVNLGDKKYTDQNDINDFNNLDIVGTTGSTKQVILLVGKGNEGWNCRSLFGVALYRKPKSTIFVLQATMRCLRQITEYQQEGRIYLSKENYDILDNELAKNFRISIKEVTQKKDDKIQVGVRLVPPNRTLRLSEIKHRFELIPLNSQTPLNFQLDSRDYTKYESKLYEADDIAGRRSVKEKVIVVKQREYSSYQIVFEVSRYLNMSPLDIDKTLCNSVDGIDKITEFVNRHNEVLRDIIIPETFYHYYNLQHFTESVTKEVKLINDEIKTEFVFNVKPDLLVDMNDSFVRAYVDKSFHVDKYCFDSLPEKEFFYQYLTSNKIKEVYFTGMFTGTSNGLSIQYMDPDTKQIRTYYPDFIALHEDGIYEIVEVKGDNMIDDEIVKAKSAAAMEIAEVSQMRYGIYKSSEVVKTKII
jgi:type III restriction enzyme